jgi:hypothetical protein
MDNILHAPDLRVYDNFLDNPHSVRSRGLRAKYGNLLGQDGEMYKRVCDCTIPEVVDALNAAMGRPIELLGMGYRLNYAGELPNHAIHSDLGWGTYAAVVYLSEPPFDQYSGTAFWRHHTGWDRCRKGEESVLVDVLNDWDNKEAWEQTAFVPSAFNRAAIYRSELFHSRWPFAAYGSGPDDGRLIVVAFFN